MKKILLSLVALLCTMGAWAQESSTPIVDIIGLEDKTYPYELPAETATTIAGLDDMTIFMTIKANTLSGRQMLICGADPTQAICGSATKDNAPYFGYGLYNENVCYMASSRAGDRFSMSGLSADAVHSVVFVVDATNGEIKSYVDGQIIQKNGDETLFNNGDASGYQLQTFKKLFAHATYGSNAKVYLGGGKLTSNSSETNHETLDGKIYDFRVYDKAMTAEEIAKNLTYTLTDIAGNEYIGTYSGTAGTDEPTLSGIANISLSNKQWTGTNFTADITFPFPVSSATVTNPTLIVNGASWGSPNSRKWRAVTITEDGTENSYVKVQTAAVSSTDVNALWAIYPKVSNEKFTVTIKSLSSNTYVKANPGAEGTAGDYSDVTGNTKPVTLAEEGTAFEYNVRDGNNCHFTYQNTSGNEVRLSMNGSGDTDVFLGVYKGSHSGNDVAFPEYVTNMTFPFTVSSKNTIQPLLMSIGGDQRKWSVKQNTDGDYYVHILNDTPELATWQWAVFPQFESNGWKYKIMNIATSKYVYAKPGNTGAQPEPQGTGYPVILNNEGTAFDVVISNNKPRFTYVNNSSTKLYLTVNGSASNDCALGVWTGTHDYENVSFPTLTSYTFTIGSTGYTTLYSPIAGTISGKVKTYAITEEGVHDGYVSLTEMTGVAANQGAIVEATAGTYTFTAGDVTSDWTSNLLKGSSVNTYVEGDAYVLSAPDGVESVGLYKATLNKNAAGETGDTHFKNNAGKAYLPATAVPAGARFLAFDFGGEETGITETENGNVKTENVEIYDLSGRRVQNAQKGIYIVNGKVVVR